MFGFLGALFGGTFLAHDFIKEKKASNRIRGIVEQMQAAEADRRKKLLNPILEDDLRRSIQDPRCFEEVESETKDIISCMPDIHASNPSEEKLLIMMVNRGFWPNTINLDIGDRHAAYSNIYIRRQAFFKWAADVLNKQEKNVAIFANAGIAECDFISNSWCKDRPECQQVGANLRGHLDWCNKLTDIQLQKQMIAYIKDPKNYVDIRDEVRSVIKTLPNFHPSNCIHPCPFSNEVDVPGIGINDREALFILMVNRGKMPIGGYCGVNGVSEDVYCEAYNNSEYHGIPREGYLVRWAENEMKKRDIICSLKNNKLPGVFRNWV